MIDQDKAKHEAAARALEFVETGMRLGLGTGSTAAIFVDLLAARVRQGLKVVGVPTSERTREQADRVGIALTSLDDTPELDLTIDGADEFDGQMRLIKGGGGALLREKIVASASARMVVIADASKRVETLGRFPLPVEVIPFGLAATRIAVENAITKAGCAGRVQLRKSNADTAFVTDGGHYILDCALGSIPSPEDLADRLLHIPGVVETGLFLGLATAIVVAGGDSGVEIIE